MASNYKITYNVDMVFCIDCTGSMDNIIDIVKNNALNFYQDVTNVMEQKHKHISQLRVRVVAFRDYLADGKDAMRVTDFFKLPEQADEFEKCVRSLKAEGGGDDPEDGLEALAYAIKSNWDTEGLKKRQVVVVWTDAATHPLGYGASSEYYPKGMAKDIAELSQWWGGAQQVGFVDNNAKRLLLFAPNEPFWNVISQNWDNVLHFPSTAGDGLSDLEYGQIIDTISNTI
ncbi:MAG: VWA domain-containing protein [Ruminococcaceae bacterium]|nr:VWA domain-containing protein [Oscillospiraceae bacterium]